MFIEMGHYVVNGSSEQWDEALKCKCIMRCDITLYGISHMVVGIRLDKSLLCKCAIGRKSKHSLHSSHRKKLVYEGCLKNHVDC